MGLVELGANPNVRDNAGNLPTAEHHDGGCDTQWLHPDVRGCKPAEQNPARGWYENYQREGAHSQLNSVEHQHRRGVSAAAYRPGLNIDHRGSSTSNAHGSDHHKEDRMAANHTVGPPPEDRQHWYDHFHVSSLPSCLCSGCARFSIIVSCH
eukprot:2463968-Rhodomonas_salina.1